MAAQNVDLVQHKVGLVLGERGRRLVENEISRIAGDCLGDFDALLGGDRQPDNPAARVDVDSEHPEGVASPVVRLGHADAAVFTRKPSQEDVLRHREFRYHPDFLVDEGDALVERLGGIAG